MDSLFIYFRRKMKEEYSYTFTSKAKNAAVAKLKIMTVFVYFCIKHIIKWNIMIYIHLLYA